MQPGHLPGSEAVNPASPQRQPISRRHRLLACATALLALWLLLPLLLRSAGRWLDVGERLDGPVDSVIVLGGDASVRPFVAAAMYRQGYTSRILVPRSDPVDPAGLIASEQQILIQVLLLKGVPEEDIVPLDSLANSTRTEAASLGRYLENHPQETVGIVTSNFHTRRTRLLFRRVLSDHRDRLHFISCPTDGYGPDNWWRFRDGVLFYTLEYAKLLRDCVR